jgi:hypothetical protein
VIDPGAAVGAAVEAVGEAAAFVANLGHDLTPQEKQQAAATIIPAVIITQLAQAAVAGTGEFVHLLMLSAVTNYTVKDCQFIGFQGDAIAVVSSNLTATERHCKNIKIINNLFDGVDNNNRNAVSLLDCDDILIQGNTFLNCSQPSMPGCIDFEPDANSPFAILKNIDVSNNYFENCTGGVGAIAFAYPYAGIVDRPENIIVSNNRFNTPATTAICVLDYNSTSHLSNFVVSGNTGVAREFMNCNVSIKGFEITGNSVKQQLPTVLCFNATDIAQDITISANRFVGDNTGAGLVIRTGSFIKIVDNSFKDFTFAAINLGIGGSTLSNVMVRGNSFDNISGDGWAVVAGGTIDGKSCIFKDNELNGYRHDFPSWKTEDCGEVVNGLTAVSFNTATLPDAFPVGESMAMLNGDTGVPPGTGGTEGILRTFRVSQLGGYEKFTYQTFHHSNNLLKIGSYFIRRRKQSLNQWESWAEVAGI